MQWSIFEIFPTAFKETKEQPMFEDVDDTPFGKLSPCTVCGYLC